MIILAVLSCLVIGYFWISGDNEVFKVEMEHLRQEYINSQKALIKTEVDSAVEYINYKKKLTAERLKRDVKNRVLEAHKVATNLYHQNIGKVSDSQLMDLIKNALRPVRFFDDRNYYFIDDLDGYSVLYPPKSQFEGNNLLKLQNKAGVRPLPDIIKIVRKKGEGFYIYNWVKYTEGRKPTEEEFPKITYFKLFKPFNWFIAVGEYEDYVEDDIRNEILSRIASIRFGDEGSLFIKTTTGQNLVSESKAEQFPLVKNSIKNLDDHIHDESIVKGAFINHSDSKHADANYKMMYIRSIPEWGWIIGADISFENVDSVIASKKSDLSNKTNQNIIRNIIILISLVAFTYFVARLVSLKAKTSFDVFSAFFKKAATDDIEINQADLHFSEFAGLAQAANEMVRSRVEVKEKLESANIELASKNKELEQIVFVTSHDLRSPLVNVQGFSKELTHSLKELAEVLAVDDIPTEIRNKFSYILQTDIPESIQFIMKSIDKMDLLLAGLLRLSRLGRAALNFQALDMNEIMHEIASTTEFEIKAKKTALEIADLPPCRGDKTQIDQVFSNLISNALKYLDPERAGTIRITGTQKDQTATYCIADNGIGIKKEHQTRIFEIFHRLDPGSSDGDGLGLTIVRRIIDRHDGNIWVESEPGKGSRFFVSLPT